jgi:hypothetical protein
MGGVPLKREFASFHCCTVESSRREMSAPIAPEEFVRWVGAKGLGHLASVRGPKLGEP